MWKLSLLEWKLHSFLIPFSAIPTFFLVTQGIQEKYTSGAETFTFKFLTGIVNFKEYFCFIETWQ